MKIKWLVEESRILLLKVCFHCKKMILDSQCHYLTKPTILFLIKTCLLFKIKKTLTLNGLLYVIVIH